MPKFENKIKVTYDNGDTYEGDPLEDGQRNGVGKYTQLETGVTFEGLWKNNTLINGTLIENSENIVFTGDFKDYILHGKGKKTRKFKSGEIHIYEGEFQNGFLHGENCKCTVTAGKITKTYTGVFRNNNLHGKGTLLHINEETKTTINYIGEFQNDRINGNVKYEMTDGKTTTTYEGERYNGRNHGYGKKTTTTNGITTVEEGMFENDKFIGAVGAGNKDDNIPVEGQTNDPSAPYEIDRAVDNVEGTPL
jgi:hypothetical protein